MSKIEFVNKSGLEFNDISAEEYREYLFPAGVSVRITAPLKLNVSASGGHRIFDAAGVSHYIATGWVHLHWKAKAGAAHFDL
ncbi:hypothetical protein ACLMJV_16900 [Sinorhizobium meliloti]|uniref:hypothetical protein n=1 Tax=Rhizobium meliloti TaxID=382 RepID=UPI00398CC193